MDFCFPSSLSPVLQIYEESKMNLEQERPFVCSAPGCSQVSVGILWSVLPGCSCLLTGKQLSLGNHACCRLSFFTKILSKPPLPLPVPPPSSSSLSSSFSSLLLFSTLNSLNYFPHSPRNTSALAISILNFSPGSKPDASCPPDVQDCYFRKGREDAAFTIVT